MMKHFMITLIALCCFINVQGQMITRNYDNVSMSEALRDLNELSRDYTISFLYNELENFRVSTHIKHKSVHDAIMQVIGFYPIRIVQRGKKDIYVECTHKTARHLTGSVIDENRQPLPYANVYLLHPSDSTVIGGGVSNEAGVFVIPYDVPTVLVRISYVGYKTIYRLCSNEQMGVVQIKPESQTIKGVVVTGERPKVQLQGNVMVMNVEGTVMERLGTAEDVLSRVPTISKKGDGYEILGKGAPLIYLNNRKLNDLNELRNIQSDFIRNVEVIQNPGARYDATVQAVIVIHTKRAQGEGLGVELTSWSSKGRGYVNNERINLTYRKGGLELFTNLFGAYNKRWSSGSFEQTVFADTLWTITNHHQSTQRNPYLEGRAGFNYQLNDSNSFGGFYQNTYDYVKTYNDNADDLLANGSTYDHLQNSGVRRDRNAPKHEANLYFTGKVGQFSIDFNADYTAYKNLSRSRQQELSRNYENRDVNTETVTRGSMAAEKLIVSHPLWKGQVSVGEEYTNTRWRSSFENAEGYIQESNNEQHESNMAPFVELWQQLGRFHLQTGLRYEHVASDYFVGAQRQADQSRIYDDLYPSVALSTSIKTIQLSVSYSKRTNRPAYWMLNNDVIYENRLNRQTGNPYLRPVKYHSLNAMLMWKFFYATTNFVHCIDPFMSVMESLDQDSKVNIATTKNYNDCDWLIVTLGAQKSVNLTSDITWTPQYNVTFMKQWLTTTFNGQDKHLNQPQLSLQLGNIVTLPHDWLLQADFNMHSHGYTGSNFKIETTNAMLSLSVSKDLFKHRLNIKLTGNDLFNQGIGHGTFYFNRMTFSKTEDNDTRFVSLSLRYRFNVTPSKYKGTGAGNAEKSRL